MSNVHRCQPACLDCKTFAVNVLWAKLFAEQMLLLLFVRKISFFNKNTDFHVFHVENLDFCLSSCWNRFNFQKSSTQNGIIIADYWIQCNGGENIFMVPECWRVPGIHGALLLHWDGTFPNTKVRKNKMRAFLVGIFFTQNQMPSNSSGKCSTIGSRRRTPRYGHFWFLLCPVFWSALCRCFQFPQQRRAWHEIITQKIPNSFFTMKFVLLLYFKNNFQFFSKKIFVNYFFLEQITGPFAMFGEYWGGHVGWRVGICCAANYSVASVICFSTVSMLLLDPNWAVIRRMTRRTAVCIGIGAHMLVTIGIGCLLFVYYPIELNLKVICLLQKAIKVTTANLSKKCRKKNTFKNKSWMSIENW